MSDFSLSKLLGGTPSSTNYPTIEVLKFEQTLDKHNILVQSTDAHGGHFPLFSFPASSGSNKDTPLYRVGAGATVFPPTQIGSVTHHSLSGNTDLTVNGQSTTLKARVGLATSYHKFDYPPVGKLKWESGTTGRKLIDGSGNKLAKYRPGSSGGIKGAALEILMPLDDTFLDVVVLSIVALVGMPGTGLAEAVDAVSALAGGGA